MTEKFLLLDQIINYAKGHYLKNITSYKDVVKIFDKCGSNTNMEHVISELARMSFNYILEADNTMNEYVEQITFMYNAIPKIIDEKTISELDSREEVMKKAKAAMGETITQALLVIIARYYPDDEEVIQKPNKKILPVRDRV